MSPDVHYWPFMWMNQSLLYKFRMLLLQQISFFPIASALGSCGKNSSCLHSRSALGKYSVHFRMSCDATQPLEKKGVGKIIKSAEFLQTTASTLWSHSGSYIIVCDILIHAKTCSLHTRDNLGNIRLHSMGSLPLFWEKLFLTVMIRGILAEDCAKSKL